MNAPSYPISIEPVHAPCLDDLIETLVATDSSPSPMISCYVDLTKPLAAQVADVQQRAAVARSELRGQARFDFDDALNEIIELLNRRPQQGKKSLAIYARWGDHPVLYSMEFDVPLESQLAVDRLPLIFPLVALKDKLNRFVVVMTSETEARIVEVVFGQVTESMLTKLPELRKRIGREWTKEHFQSHKRNRHTQFLKEKVKTIEKLMEQKGFNHLIISGSAPNVARLSNALPQRIRDRVIDPKEHRSTSSVNEAVTEALQLFIEQEEKESQTAVKRLHAAIMTNGLGVAGHEACYGALTSGQADMLIIRDTYPVEQREILVKTAVQAKVDIETVSESELLDFYGGAGCLLRYKYTT